MRFTTRTEAGALLAQRLSDVSGPLVVLAVDETSLPVAAVVAAALGAPLGRYATAHLALPFRPTLPYGAVTDDNHHFVDPIVAADHALTAREIAAHAKSLLPQLRRQRGSRPELAGQSVVLVQDGVTWGYRALAALASARAAGAERVIIATPVAALDVAAALSELDVTFHALHLEDGPRFHVPDFYAA